MPFRASPAYDKPVLTEIEDMGAANEHFLANCALKHGQGVPKDKLHLTTYEFGGDEYQTNGDTRQAGTRPNPRTASGIQRLPSLSPTPSRVLAKSPTRIKNIGESDLDRDQGSAGISRNDAMPHLQLPQREYIRQLGDKCINTWYPPLKLEPKTLLNSNPNLKRFNDFKIKLNNQMNTSSGDSPAVIMHSPQPQPRYNLNRNLPLNLATINR